MRLEHLTITAVGPFAGTEDIDFDALTRGGLFLLEGPTGAGKSTVLDAITFALFGQPAGETTSSDRLRSHFAPPDSTPTVVLTFSVRGQRLRLTRVPEHLRPKRRGDGVTPEKARVHLESHDGSGWISVSSNIAEVAEEIEHRLGLNRAQFTKVVLLPQGEFATFLRAKDDVRRSVLSQIFGTVFYDKVTRQLEDWRRDARRERDLADEAVTKAIAALGAASGLQDAVEVDADDVALTVLATELGALVEESVDAEAEALAARETAVVRRDELAALGQAHLDLADLLGRRAAHAAGSDTHAARLLELDRARAAAPVGLVLRQLDHAQAVLSARRADAVALRAGLTGDETAADAEGLDTLARADDDTAAGLRPLADTEASLAQLRARATAYDEQIEVFEGRAKQLEVRRHELPTLIADLETDVARLTALTATLPALETAHDVAQNRLTAATSLLTVERDLAAALLARTGAERAHLDARASRLALLDTHLQGMAAELASHLHDGAPCPVCGGTEHPMPADLGVDHVTRDQVDDAERVEAAAAERLETAAGIVAQFEKRQASLAAQASGYDLDTAATQLAAVVVELDDARAAVPALASTREQLAALRTEAEVGEREESEARQELVRLSTERAAALEGLHRDEAAVTLARDQFDSVRERIDSLHARAHAARAAAGAVRDIVAARATVEAKEREVEELATSSGFLDPDDARGAVRSAAEVAALDDLVQAWESQAVVLAELAADPRLAGLDPAAAAGVVAALDAAHQDCASRSAALEAVQAERTRREQRLAGFRAHRAQLDQRRSERAQVYAATAAVHRLAGLANGSSGSPRMSMSTYVLRRWFESVVEAANLRLDRMSAGRYQLERTDEAERKVDQAGLGLLVIDRHTGEARSPRSLSGGETFYTSLALALGLADVVRAEAGGVDLDTLFIDEGFGTLDTETLELVMAVIDELRDGGRAVGIVSHVADLKDQVTERLEIRRTHPQGPSTTRVVA
ncbi:MAG TPA: SMC family ATPase [Candidatus Nanopelagicales bacterium]|nr:SMC family ATPase [Candidatus Nanopelagicales bacterium]